MRVLVTGANGQLGYDVIKVLNEHLVVNKGIDIDEVDLTDKYQVEKIVTEYQPTHIVHCAAFTAVDKAEELKDVCFDVNVNGTKYIAEICKKQNISMMYISTDYIFDGNGIEPFSIDSSPNPVNYYGLTKLLGEKEVQRLLSDFFIVRISWVFGVNGNNFIKKMLELSNKLDSIKVVNDQIGSPTYTYDLANAIYKLLTEKIYGIHHITNSGYCSWYELAKFTLEHAKKKINLVPINSDEYITTAKRPLNSRMMKNNIVLRDWKEAVIHYLDQLGIK